VYVRGTGGSNVYHGCKLTHKPFCLFCLSCGARLASSSQGLRARQVARQRSIAKKPAATLSSRRSRNCESYLKCRLFGLEYNVHLPDVKTAIHRGYKYRIPAFGG
jgi:hypothetical protein